MTRLTYTKAIKRFLQVGIQPLPITPKNLMEKKKYPTFRWRESGTVDFGTFKQAMQVGKWSMANENFEYSQDQNWGVWLRGGHGFGNLDFDPKNNNGDTSYIEAYTNKVASVLPNIFDKIFCEQTPSGGIHWIFTLDTDKPFIYDTVLAYEFQGKDKDGNDKYNPIIESKNEGYGIVCYPTPNYKPVKFFAGKEFKANFDSKVSISEYKTLLEIAKQFCNKPKIVATTAPKPAQSKVNYNLSIDETDAKSKLDAVRKAFNDSNDMVSILTGYGWTIARTRATGNDVYVKQPNTTNVHSGKVFGNSDKLYLYSTNTDLGDGNKTLDCFAVVTIKEYGGNQTALYKELFDSMAI